MNKIFGLILLITSNYVSSELQKHTNSESIKTKEAIVNRVEPDLQGRQIRTVEAKTTQGSIIGRVESSELPTVPPTLGQEYFAFRGIPYAKPPVGDLRWRDPEDLLEQWPGGQLDGMMHRSFCPQYDHDKNVVVGDEDCLFLNVYTPRLPEMGGEELGVLVFIHGGAYTRGTAVSHGPQKLMRENLVVVTLNYRLGVFGLLSTEDETIAGNFGALDQISALRWVKRNIGSFGGNPEKITLGGFSAGAAYVHFHMLSPLSKGLFHNAIMMSGSANCKWSVQEEPWQVAKELGVKLDCSVSSSSSLRHCLASKSTETLIKAQTEMHRYVYWPFKFRPIVDKYYRKEPFLPQTVSELHKEGNISHIPLLIGGTHDEGILFALTTMMFSENRNNPDRLIREDAKYIIGSLWNNRTEFQEICDVIYSYYFNDEIYQYMDRALEDLAQAITDLLFTSCLWDAAEDIAKRSGSPVYPYLMNYHESSSPSLTRTMYNMAEDLGVSTSLLESGVSHGDDMVLIFSFPFNVGDPSENDQEMSFALTHTITSFVNTGNPQGGIRKPSDPFYWYPLEADGSGGYFWFPIDFDRDGLSNQLFRVKERNFWKQTTTIVDAMIEEKFSWFVATWLLLTILILAIILVIVLSIVIYKVRRSFDYPGVGIPVLKTRAPRNPSLSCSDH